MRTLSIPFPMSSDRSFLVALGLVAVFAAAEISAVGYHYLASARVRGGGTQPSVAAMRTPAPAPATSPAAAEAAAPAAVKSAPPISQSDQVVNEAVALRDRGDTANALGRLQGASEQDPKNPKILEELAKTYEAVQNIDLANETWRKIQQLGPSAGASFAMADQRLKTGLAAPAASGAGLPGPGRLDVAPSGTAGQPSSEGSAFEISQLNVSETPDADADTNLVLRVGIQKRTKAVIDHTKVKIQVFFYDTVDDKDIKLTDADVTYEWLTPNHDWADTAPEILAVNYVRPKNKVLPSEAALSAAAASVNPGKKTRANKPGNPDSGQRKYLGYIVRVYYQDQLQAVRAEPSRLLKLYPPPSTASP
jgi:tetratricopeptide (TPR) repeat protein